MSTTISLILAFVFGCLFMVLIRVFIYGLSLLTIKKGEKLKTKGEEIAQKSDELLKELQSIQDKLNG